MAKGNLLYVFCYLGEATWRASLLLVWYVCSHLIHKLYVGYKVVVKFLLQKLWNSC